MSDAEVFDTISGAGFQGWVPGFHDKDDKYYSPKPNVDISKTTSFTLRSHAPMDKMVIYDQGAANSCVANASSLAYWYELRKASDKSLEDQGPSRYFLWYNALKGDNVEGFSKGPLVNTGTWNRHAMKLLNKQGVCTEKLFPYIQAQSPSMTEDQYNNWVADQLKTPPKTECYNEAASHKIAAYYRLDADRPVDENVQPRTPAEKDAVGEICLDNLKRCLLDEHPVVFAFRYYWKYIPWVQNGNIWSMPNIWAGTDRVVASRHSPPSANFGGHAVVAIGFDDSKQAILCQNSWGNKTYPTFQSEGGLFYMSYDWIKDFAATNDFWTCRLDQGEASLTEDEVNTRVQNKIKQMSGH